MKRDDYLNWDQYFMSIALLSAERSKDPNTQVGTCIVSDDNKILAIGYNGMPTGINDEDLPWAREGAFGDTKYAYVCHAELNAILNSHGADLKGATLYTSMFPCNECAKAIIQSGIKEVVYYSNKYPYSDSTAAAKLMFALAKVKTREYPNTVREITLKI